jgi:hypothetical protein
MNLRRTSSAVTCDVGRLIGSQEENGVRHLVNFSRPVHRNDVHAFAPHGGIGGATAGAHRWHDAGMNRVGADHDQPRISLAWRTGTRVQDFRTPDRVVAAVLCQPVGHRPENPDVMYKSGKDFWAPELLARRPDLNMAMVDKYLHDLHRVRPDFVYSVSRDFAWSCQTPMLVMPDDSPAHPYQTSVDIASLAPNAEVTVYPWREPPELKERTINRVRIFLKAHQPETASR